MNQRDKRITSYFILFSLMIILGVIYAILQANLQINGTAKISKNEWNVHFDNIVVNQDSVPIGTGDTAATIDPTNNCKVDFSVTLSLPGDFYEFNVDVVNEGTIDAMIGTLVKTLKVNDVSTEEVPEYLNYIVTYQDGTEILENHILIKNTFETYKVRVEIKRDVTQLPEAATISMSMEPVFIQADSGAVQPTHTFFHQLSQDAVIDNIASTYVTNENGIQFGEISSDTNGKGLYLRAGTENDPYPIYYYRGAVSDNNVLFGGFCWKIVRTTDTGGIKLIYNGLPSGENSNQCTNTTGSATQLDTLVQYNENFTALGSYGYMYGTTYGSNGRNMINTSTPYMYGTGYDETNHKLITTGAISFPGTEWRENYTRLNNNHYTCFNSSGECNQVYYIFYTIDLGNTFYSYSIRIPSGKTVTDVFNDIVLNPSNTTSSTIKNVIDSWYQANMIDYTNMLEDTIWCSDRSVINYEESGWNPNGGQLNKIYSFGSYSRIYREYNPSTICINKNDSFTVNESSKGNGKLIYPVGMITADEVMLAGSIETGNGTNNSFYLYTGQNYWTITPTATVSNSASLVVSSDGVMIGGNQSNLGVRPSVSLKSGVVISGGDGTGENPYTVE